MQFEHSWYQHMCSKAQYALRSTSNALYSNKAAIVSLVGLIRCPLILMYFTRFALVAARIVHPFDLAACCPGGRNLHVSITVVHIYP